jgi:NitT/TauT family transport system permease protein
MIASVVVLVLAVLVGIWATRFSRRTQALLLPTCTALALLAAWHMYSIATEYELRSTQADGVVETRLIRIFPTPWDTMPAMVELASDGRLARYAMASLFRVLSGFALAVFVGIPLGLWAGWRQSVFLAINPLIQGLRPISPLAWIPIAVLSFGIQDEAAIFIIFLGAFFPIVTGTMTAVQSIPLVYVRSAQNFGLSGFELFRRVVFPAALPQIVTSLRIALGVGWLVVVAAEMNAVNSGLGFLLIDARNMGNRYDLVVASMIAIGLIGIALDWAVRRLEHLDEVRWGFRNQQ